MTKYISAQIIVITPELLRYAHYLGDSADIAQVLVQQTVERVLKRHERQASVEDLKKYMFTILHNLHNDHLRRKQRNSGDISDQEIIDPGLSAGGRLACREALEMVNKLSEAHREVLRLIQAGQSYAQIATRLGLPIGTVMSRVSRARHALRQAMDMQPEQSVVEWLGQ
ncbi:MAG: sigma-70 family RNA polymerase sigma factor [Rhodobacteraceae bacterium]|nr:sigma-70 family RNA polymerase sigma factor [Paracoccaceae bacterium]